MGDSPKSARFWLCIPPTLACGCDVLMTLLGQGGSYWAGDYASVDEFNPLARLLLQQHPAAFLAAAVLSSVLVSTVLLRLPGPLAVVACFLVTFGHTVAAASWLARFGLAGVAGAVLLLLAAERVFSMASHRAGAFPEAQRVA